MTLRREDNGLRGPVAAHPLDLPGNACARGILVTAGLHCCNRHGTFCAPDDRVLGAEGGGRPKVDDKPSIFLSSLPNDGGAGFYAEGAIAFRAGYIRGSEAPSLSRLTSTVQGLEVDPQVLLVLIVKVDWAPCRRLSVCASAIAPLISKTIHVRTRAE